MRNIDTSVKRSERLPYCSLFTVRCSLFTVRCSLPQRHYSLFPVRCSLKGFTLVELLTVIVILSILASLSMFALNVAYEEAKSAKTRGTIQKLDAAIQQIFEGYEEKFDAISIDKTKLGIALGRAVTDADIGIAKLHFIRDLMRMEMPNNWDEVRHNRDIANPFEIKHGPIPIQNGSRTPYQIDPPAVLQYYRNADATYTLSTTLYSSPELLYLIIANLNPEALENFHGNEIGDIDGNGLMEFHDAWGTPIRFIRFAPAFVGSDKQPDIITYSELPLRSNGTNTDPTQNDLNRRWIADSGAWVGPTGVPLTDWANPSLLSANINVLVDAMKEAASQGHDPFDSHSHTRSWFLYPVIVSAGPDKIFDLEVAYPNLVQSVDLPNIYDPFLHPVGMPEDKDNQNDGSPPNGVLNHYDNIHNHRQSGGF